MKRVMIFLILICISVLFADVINQEDNQQLYEKQLNLNKTYFNDILSSTVEFSKQEYGVNDYIEVTIHLKLDAKKNIYNKEFVILDLKNREFYTMWHNLFDKITEQDIIDVHKRAFEDFTFIKFIDSDPDIIINNNNPSIDYKMKFVLTNKVKSISINKKEYPYFLFQLDIVEIYEKIKYKNFTKYNGHMKACYVPIKFNQNALLRLEDQKQKKAKKKQKKNKRGNKIFDANTMHSTDSSRDRITLKVLANETTYMALNPEPFSIYITPPSNLGTFSIEEYGEDDYNCIRIDASDLSDVTAPILYYYQDEYSVLQVASFDVNIIDSYSLEGNVEMHNNTDLIDFLSYGRGTMQIVDEYGVVVEQIGDMITSSILSNGEFELIGISSDYFLKYVAENNFAKIEEFDGTDVATSSHIFSFTPQEVYYILNNDNSNLNLRFKLTQPGWEVDEFEVYYYNIVDAQVIADNWIFASQVRAEVFSQSVLANPAREKLIIYADIQTPKPGYPDKSFFVPDNDSNPHDELDFIQIKPSDIQHTSIVLHELGHAHHWHHAGFSTANSEPHWWSNSYSKELAWREGFATFFSSLVRHIQYSNYGDDTSNYMEYFVYFRYIDIELPDYDPKGNKCEGAVCGFLWDIYDWNNYLSDDDDLCTGAYTVPVSIIWQATKGTGYQSVISVDEFVSSLFNLYPPFNNTQVGSVMAAFEIYDEVVEDGETLVIPPQRTNFDFTEFSSILVEEGGALEILDNTIITFSNPSNCFYVKGDIVIGDNVTFNNVGNVSDRQIVLDNASAVVFDNSDFTNCKVEILGTDVEILDSDFTNSCIEAYKTLNKEEILVDNCDFSGVYGTNPSISIDSYYSADINYCTFNNSENSISVYETGNKSGCTISNNSITNSTGKSIDLYHTKAKLYDNEIFGNEWGILGVRKSNISLFGPNQYIQDNDDFELVFEHDSFPIFFEYNTVSHDNSNSESLITVVHAVNVPYNVKNNNWGNPRSVRDELHPYGFFDFTPIWNGLRNEPTLEDSIREMYTSAIEALDSEHYIQAETILKEIIEIYSNSTYAVSSAKDLITVVANTSNNYADLKNYYDFINNSNLSTELSRTCNYLSNHCNILMEDYDLAINWFEYQINHPYSEQDSIYALIDLNHTYLLLDKVERSNLINDKYCFKPLSFDHFHNKRSDLIDTFFNSENDNSPELNLLKLDQNYPNPFNPQTTINFSIPDESKVDLTIYNVKGQKVRTLTNEVLPEGQHSVVWHSKDNYGKGVASGVYFYKLSVNGKSKGVKKCLLLK